MNQADRPSTAAARGASAPGHALPSDPNESVRAARRRQRLRLLPLAVLAATVGLSGCDPKPKPTTTSAAPAYQAVPPNGNVVAQNGAPAYPQNPAPAAYPQQAPGAQQPQPQQQPAYPANGYAPPAYPQPVPQGAAPAPYPNQPVATYPNGQPQPVYPQQPAYPQQPPTQVAAAPVYNDNGPPAATPPPRAATRAPVAQRAAVPSGSLGRVTSIEEIREQPAGTGAGGVAGAVVGGLVGNHFGGGLGRTALTVLGAGGGAVAGNQIERKVRERTVGYRVHVRLDDGETRTIQEDTRGDLRVGDRVRVTGNGLRRL